MAAVQQNCGLLSTMQQSIALPIAHGRGDIFPFLSFNLKAEKDLVLQVVKEKGALLKQLGCAGGHGTWPGTQIPRARSFFLIFQNNKLKTQGPKAVQNPGPKKSWKIWQAKSLCIASVEACIASSPSRQRGGIHPGQRRLLHTLSFLVLNQSKSLYIIHI